MLAVRGQGKPAVSFPEKMRGHHLGMGRGREMTVEPLGGESLECSGNPKGDPWERERSSRERLQVRQKVVCRCAGMQESESPVAPGSGRCEPYSPPW